MTSNPIIEILGEFGAGYGQPENLAVRFLLAAFFWAVLGLTALRQWRRGGQPQDRWLGAAALLGLSRELWMFFMEYAARRGLLPHDATHPFYPPLEHLLTQFSYLCIGAALANYFHGPRRLVKPYLLGNAVLIVGAYAVVQSTWPAFLAADPSTGFSAFPGDVWLHGFMVWLLAPVFGGLLLARRAGQRIPGTLFAALSLFLLDDLLMIVHLGLGSIHPEVFAPLRHNLHIWAVPLLIAMYWEELTRRLVEEREKTTSIVAAIGDGVSIHAPDLKVTYQNQVHRDMVGDVVGKFCYQVYRHRDSVCEDCAVQAAMADGHIHSSERAYTRSGKVLAVTASPLRNADGKVVGGIEVVRDLTEQRVLEQRTAEAQKLEAVGRLAGGVAHDFNNLLTVILGRTELLLVKEGQSDSNRHGLNEIHRVAERAADLTRQLLAFGRRQPRKPAVMNLNQVLDETEPILRRLMPENVRLEISRGPEPAPVLADSSQLEQVVVNLTVNARDAMPGGGTLRITTGNEEVVTPRQGRHGCLASGRYAVLTVTDSGTGMGEEVMNHLFEPFFTTKADSHGTGLGLATVFGIVEQSLGHIVVESKPSRGSTFRVYLPRTVEVAKEATVCAVPVAAVGGGETVLVVEDDGNVRDLVAGILSDAGYEVLTAPRGREALNRAEAHAGPIHLLLADVIMPEMSGVELAQELAHHRPDTPVLYMSGYTADQLAGAGANPEDIDLLDKPFTPQELLGRVRRSMAGRQAA